MPSKFTPELEQVPVEQQRTKLQQLKDSLPQLSIRVPSILDAISYWQSLRAKGVALSGDDMHYKTGIRHIDLEPRRLDSFLSVPLSGVNVAGKPLLSSSFAEVDGDARVLVG